VLTPNRAHMVHDVYEVTVNNVPEIIAHGDTGQDTAFLVDSEANDVFVAGAHYASMRALDNAYRNETKGFEIVTGNAVMGGYDLGVLIDSSGNDHFRVLPEFSQMFGGGSELRASRFEQFTAHHRVGGDDLVEFVDSAGDDLFRANMDSATMRGDGFENRVEGFHDVRANATRGGNDVAELYDSPADDEFVASHDQATLSGPGFSNQVRNFDITSGYSVLGGNDIARLRDSVGDDVFVGRGTYSELRGDGFKNRANGFAQVIADATAGGNDLALMLDVSGIDWFTSQSTSAAMRSESSTYENVVRHFETVRATSDNSENVAEFDDVESTEMLMGRNSMAHLGGAERDVFATGFGVVNATAKTGETAQADIHNVDFVFSQFGDWS
ncbi:MAG: hypothetical protein AAF497_18405, partial [Planctomycetota bacterium]